MTRLRIRFIVWTASMALATSCSSGSTTSPATLSTSSVVASTTDAIPSAPLDSAHDSNSIVAESVLRPCAVGAAAVVTKFLQAIDARDTATYERCEGITQGQERIDGLRHGGWNLTAIQNQDSSDEVVRFDLKSPEPPADTYVSGGSIVHALVPQSGTVITVAREPGGGYFVTNIEFYSSSQ
jgi:hypothetical protein